jgi:hypothetical protein
MTLFGFTDQLLVALASEALNANYFELGIEDAPSIFESIKFEPNPFYQKDDHSKLKYRKSLLHYWKSYFGRYQPLFEPKDKLDY